MCQKTWHLTPSRHPETGHLVPLQASLLLLEEGDWMPTLAHRASAGKLWRSGKVQTCGRSMQSSVLPARSTKRTPSTTQRLCRRRQVAERLWGKGGVRRSKKSTKHNETQKRKQLFARWCSNKRFSTRTSRSITPLTLTATAVLCYNSCPCGSHSWGLSKITGWWRLFDGFCKFLPSKHVVICRSVLQNRDCWCVLAFRWGAFVSSFPLSDFPTFPSWSG